jgi:hypothetical protein
MILSVSLREECRHHMKLSQDIYTLASFTNNIMDQTAEVRQQLWVKLTFDERVSL